MAPGANRASISITTKQRPVTANKPLAAWALSGLLLTLHTTADAQETAATGRLDTETPVTYFIAEGVADSGYRDSDRELAIWALEAWERSAGGELRFVPGPESTALLRVYWVPADFGQYGEMRPLLVDGRRGAAVFIRPDTDALGEEIGRRARTDPLFRDTVVYLTCLHELGHALGLGHTSNYADIMYFFGFGGDIPGFFARYRNRLQSRGDIARVAGLSDDDLRRLESLYSSTPGVGED